MAPLSLLMSFQRTVTSDLVYPQDFRGVSSFESRLHIRSSLPVRRKGFTNLMVTFAQRVDLDNSVERTVIINLIIEFIIISTSTSILKSYRDKFFVRPPDMLQPTQPFIADWESHVKSSRPLMIRTRSLPAASITHLHL